MTSRLLPGVALILAVLVAGCSKNDGLAARAANAGGAPSVPLAMLPRDVVPTHYRLAFTIDPAKERFSGHTEIDVVVAKPEKSFFLHGLDLHVVHATARLASGTVEATYTQVHDSGVATLSFAKSLPKGRATLVFDYDAPFNTSLAGLYKVVDAGSSYAFTQFENIDARRAFPSFDEPGFKTPFDVTVTAPAADKVIANTPVVSSASAAGGMIKWVFEPTKPLPTYLVALAVGPLDIVDAGDIPADKVRDHPLHLRGIAAKGMGPKMKYALSLTPAVIQALENYYGVPYPYQKLDILAVPDFSAGAMENAGAVTFREQLLLMDDNAPLDQRRASLTVQAHELAHQWFGDLVTPHWWDDIWLNESFATWMEYKISQMVRPQEEYSRSTLNSSLNVMRLDELPSARQIHNPVNNPDDIDNAFDDITYSKGGAVLSMFESFVGPAEFQKGIHAYLQKYAFGNATAHDFISTIAETTHHPEIVQAFDDFIDQPHIPLLRADTKCASGGATAAITQSMYKPIGISMPERAWHVPACMSVETGSSGREKAGAFHDVCHLVPPAASSVPVGSTCPELVFPNAQGAGYYRFTTAEPQWRVMTGAGPSLSAADQLTLFHNVAAALRAGQAQASDFFAVIETLAPMAQWDLVAAINDAVHEFRVSGVIGASDLPKLQSLIRARFGPRMQPLGLSDKPGEPAATTLLRQHLAELLVNEGRDPALTAQLAKAAHTYLSSGGKDYGGMAPELRQEAMRAGVMAEGPSFSDLLIAAIRKSNDEYFVQTGLYALAGAEDAATLNKVLALALTPEIRTGDLRYVLRYFTSESAARPVLWTWFKANFAALEKRLSRRGMGYAPDLQHYGCDPQTKADLVAFFGPKAKDLVGSPRVLKQTEERIDRCMAFKAAKGSELAAALRNAR
jgi:cytosol alanyl aminopeptidase